MKRVKLACLAGSARERFVHVGAWRQRVPCELNLETGRLALTQAVLSEVGLEAGIPVNAQVFDDGDAVRVGPLVGVLLGNRALGLLHGPWSARYRAMSREARGVGAVPLFFLAQDVDMDEGRVAAWIERRGRWEQMVLPVPDVIYNRVTLPCREERKAVAACLKELRLRHSVVLLNSQNAFSKWQVHEALTFFPDTIDLTPHTVQLEDEASVTAMIGRYRSVYAKANYGSHGSMVLKIARETGGWRVSGRYAGQETNEMFAEEQQLIAFLLLLRGSDSWVLQRGIESPLVDGRVFDLRAIAQKDSEGAWCIPMVIVRRAREGSVAANMSQGGEPYLPEDFAKQFKDQLPPLPNMTKLISDVTSRVVLALESRFGVMGEVGVDIGLDQEGRPWVFEANTKPLHPTVHGLQDRLVRYPFHFGVHLAGRRWNGLHSGLLPLESEP